MANPPAGPDSRGDEVDVSASAGTSVETAVTAWQQRTEEILVDACRRDEAADARDVVSDAREMVADLEAFLGPDQAYHGLEERLAAAADRSRAKGDRQASAQDRVDLTDRGAGEHHPDVVPGEPEAPSAR